MLEARPLSTTSCKGLLRNRGWREGRPKASRCYRGRPQSVSSDPPLLVISTKRISAWWSARGAGGSLLEKSAGAVLTIGKASWATAREVQCVMSVDGASKSWSATTSSRGAVAAAGGASRAPPPTPSARLRHIMAKAAQVPSRIQGQVGNPISSGDPGLSNCVCAPGLQAVTKNIRGPKTQDLGSSRIGHHATPHFARTGRHRRPNFVHALVLRMGPRAGRLDLSLRPNAFCWANQLVLRAARGVSFRTFGAVRH